MKRCKDVPGDMGVHTSCVPGHPRRKCPYVHHPESCLFEQGTDTQISVTSVGTEHSIQYNNHSLHSTAGLRPKHPHLSVLCCTHANNAQMWSPSTFHNNIEVIHPCDNAQDNRLDVKTASACVKAHSICSVTTLASTEWQWKLYTELKTWWGSVT